MLFPLQLMCHSDSIVNKSVPVNSSDVWVCSLKPCFKLACSATAKNGAGYSPGSNQYQEYTDLRGKIRIRIKQLYRVNEIIMSIERFKDLSFGHCICPLFWPCESAFRPSKHDSFYFMSLVLLRLSQHMLSILQLTAKVVPYSVKLTMKRVIL